MGMKLNELTIEPQVQGFTVSVRWKHDNGYQYVKYAFTTIDDAFGLIKLVIVNPEAYEPEVLE